MHNIMKRFISIIAACICFANFVKAGTTDITGIDNVIYITPVKADAGETKALSICMKNKAEIRGFQFDLYLPDGVTIAVNKKGKMLVSLNSSRLDEDDEHSILVEQQEDSSYRFLCNSMYEETFLGNDGEIATVTLNIDASMADGVYPVVIKNQKLSETDISKHYETELVETTMTIGNPEVDPAFRRGDANGDGVINMQDVMFIVNYILKGKFPDEE